MLENNAWVYGATGAIGQELIEQLKEKGFSVKAVVRKQTELFDSSIQQVVVENDQYNQGEQMKNADVFIAIGTTAAKTPDQDEYYRIDHDIPLEIAQSCARNEVRSLHVVSAKGAKASSSIRYNRIKGEMERDVSEAFKGSYFYRPSLLLGKRDEKRPMESIAKWFFTYFSWLIPSSLKGIDHSKVAQVMVHNAMHPTEKKIWESEEMRKF